MSTTFKQFLKHPYRVRYANKTSYLLMMTGRQNDYKFGFPEAFSKVSPVKARQTRPEQATMPLQRREPRPSEFRSELRQLERHKVERVLQSVTGAAGRLAKAEKSPRATEAQKR